MDTKWIVTAVVCGLVGVLAAWKRRKWIGDNVLRKLFRSAGRSSGGWLKNISPLKWFFVVLFGWILFSIGSCIYTLPGQYDRTAKDIAKAKWKFEHDVSEAWDRFTSPAERPPAPEPAEDKLASSPLYAVEMANWWTKRGRPRLRDGWRENGGEEVSFTSSGEVGLEPVINTTFWDGYKLTVLPTYGFGPLGSAFTSPIVVDLVGNTGRNVNKAVLLGRLGGRDGFTTAPYYARIEDAGLVWCRTRSTSSSGRTSKFKFRVLIEPPEDNPRLVRRKQGSVRYAYWREFRPMVGAESEVARCCRLPFEIKAASGETVRVDFDLDVILTPLPPQPDRKAVDRTRLNAQDLLQDVVSLALVEDDNKTPVFPRRQISKWRWRLRSEDIRRLWPDPHQHKHANLWFKSLIPVGVHVAVQVGGAKR